MKRGLGTTTTKRLQLKRLEGWHKPPDGHAVSCPAIFGSWYIVRWPDVAGVSSSRPTYNAKGERLFSEPDRNLGLSFVRIEFGLRIC